MNKSLPNIASKQSFYGLKIIFNLLFSIILNDIIVS